MTDSTEGKAEIWSEAVTLFDDGKYSVISATHDGKPKLAGRWNRDTDYSAVNLPIMAGYACASEKLWHIIPPFLEVSILHGLLHELSKDREKQIARSRCDLILSELNRRQVATP